MTRKKWNRLRRQRPELFKHWFSWEKLNEFQIDYLRKRGKRELIAEETARRIAEVGYDFSQDNPSSMMLIRDSL